MIEDVRLYECLYSGNQGPVKPCGDDLCGIKLRRGDECFMDPLLKKIYCLQCGQCLRYARKKAAQRGEPIKEATQ
jgi:hypothetical protein